VYIPNLFVATRRQDQPSKIFSARSTKQQDRRSGRQYNNVFSGSVQRGRFLTTANNPRSATVFIPYRTDGPLFRRQRSSARPI